MDSDQCTERTKWLPLAYKCTDQPKIWNIRWYECCLTTSEISLTSVWNCMLHCQNIDLHIILESSVYIYVKIMYFYDECNYD